MSLEVSLRTVLGYNQMVATASLRRILLAHHRPFPLWLRITVMTNTNKQVSIEVCLLHYGHRQNLQHVWMSKKRQQEVIAQLTQGGSEQKTLDDIRDNVGSRLTRDHLINKI